MLFRWVLAATAASLVRGQGGSQPFNETFQYKSGTQILTVLNLNFWGLGWPWGSDKDVRIKALREELLQGKYDIVLLQGNKFSKIFF